MKSSTLKTLAGAGTTFVFALTMATAAQAQVAVTINGNAVNVQPEPLIQDGRVFVPLRGVLERLGASVVYDNGLITAQGYGNDIALHIGSTDATVNNQPQTIDVAPFIVGASTYVPLRFISQALGANVSWDESDHLVAISMAGGEQNPAPPAQSYAGYADYTVSAPPPPIPDYQAPPCPDPNDIWQPGYWSWGTAGYYWVPGVWVAPPQTSYVWTPGYWAWHNGLFGFIAGYWGLHVGFYGGINYGGGYYGNGWAGGRWIDNTVHYNTAVVRVNTTVIRNVYVDRTVINNVVVNRAGYNGGPNGVAARPTQTQIGYQSQRRLPQTPVQIQHVHYASTDRQLLSTVNHGAPPVLVAPHPFSAVARPAGPPVTMQDRAAAQHAIARPAAAAYHPPAAAPASRPAAALVAHPVAPAARPAAPAQLQRVPAYAQPQHQPVMPVQTRLAVPVQAHPQHVQPHPATPAQLPARPAYVAPQRPPATQVQSRPAYAQPHPVMPAQAPRPQAPAQRPHPQAPEHARPTDPPR